MSELTSEIIESVVTAYKGGMEIISTEYALAKWDALNKKNANWNPGVWWEGFEEDDLITCGKCTGESEESTGLCTCSESDHPDGRKLLKMNTSQFLKAGRKEPVMIQTILKI